MSLKLRFLIWVTAAIGLVLVGMERYLDHFLTERMTEQVRKEARVILEFATASRAYVRQELRPALEAQTSDFLMEGASSTFLTTRIFSHFNDSGLGYRYRQPSLNPLNLNNLPNGMEATLIERFQKDPNLIEIFEPHQGKDGQTYYVMARPVEINGSCLHCHGDPDNAPESVRQRYGVDSGFGWQPGSIISATVVTLPSNQLIATYQHLSGTVLPIVFAIIALLLMYLVHALFEGLIYRRLLQINSIVTNFLGREGSGERVKDLRNDEIGGLGRSVNQMADAVQEYQGKLQENIYGLQNSNIQLSQEVERRHLTEAKLQQSLQEQQTISTLLKTAHAESSMQEKLELVLKKLISFPWLSLEAKGSIFLADEANKKLSMVVQKDLAAPLLLECKEIPYGTCLCGRAAQSRETVFEAHVHENHEISFAGMHDHGHYCVPILSGDELLGVLNLYVAAGYKPDHQDELFLQTIVHALSHIITHGRHQEQMKKAQKAAIVARRSAEAANSAKSQFLANVSHEIRTPLNAILGIGELLAEGELDDVKKDYIQTLNRAGEGLLGIINDVLDFSKIEAGQLGLDPIPFNLKDLLEQTHAIIAVSARNHSVEMLFQPPLELPAYVMGDELRLKQILLNLLSNSTKFTETGQIILAVEAAGQDFYRFSVQDTGIGIPAEKLLRIFEPFAQVDASTTRQFGGTGLGLAICRQLVEKMGGQMWVESVEGVGSHFFFTARLPKVTARTIKQQTGGAAGQSKVETLEAPAYQEDQGLKILVVDDAVDNRNLMAAYLAKTPHLLSFAENGLQAVELATHEQFDLILMDVQMPQMDGLQATREIRRWEQSKHQLAIPIVALTAHASSDDRHKAVEAGCNDHVTKPLKKTRLLDILARYQAETPRHG
ncbi:c-type heme family protein [Magnetococcus sp. PR-3]|uniref:c-type heme family protein n=1 Tax=Magnetococcus sp. PR-3 TaxID=3120355 RepID=UPI002FCE3EDA